MDITINKEYVTVVDGKGQVMVAEYFDKARIETLQTLQHSPKLVDISKTAVYKVPEDGIVEKNKLYLSADKVIAPIKTGDIKKVTLRIDKVAKIII